ncbi:Co-chaperone protein SBA1 [Nakaseomyces glabratus]|uniref:Co-chaperone protein SBA1 n=1 Tax=Candida glabrata TaxID=5478 RepID=A0A0W0CRC0_CANGB|nr:Co-chaperone protein SBA1 [Nakaseomyces glabratus]KTB04780.1 Co-chaperone protein SBA1 [Nakaseomyces glabratus]KTB10000.1 Co-chaperone protein SBA1 [Nakaseomyces glabratus]KTB24000.1 Co-chaperone protein SBA1 [Nakaseomyces glabratus]
MSKVLTPEVAWAQRSSESDAEKNYLLITVSIPDCESPEVKIEAGSLDLEAQSRGHVGDEHKHTYKLHIDFYKDIVPEKSLHKIANGQHYFLKLFKKDLELEYWPRLTKEKIKYSNIKTDFDKWVDEDEQETAADTGMPGDMDFSQLMGGMGGAGMGGMGGMGGPGGPSMEQLQSMLSQQGGLGGLGGEDLGDFGGDDEDEEEIEEIKKD